MSEEFIENIVNMYKNDNWEDILNLDIETSNENAHYLLWVWPNKENLDFINKLVLKHELKGILSVGCGTGLFEWLLHKCTIMGLEVDQSWWASKYSKHKFIPLNFISMPVTPEALRSDYALLFCYFNNGPAFKEYVRCYSGNMIFIIGPGNGRNTVTNPEPFNPNFESNEWSLLDYQEIRNTKDFIAVYVR